MMTYRVGAAAGITVSKAISEYYLSDTLRSETMRPAAYYAGAEERRDEFWDSQVLSDRLEIGQHRAELRQDISPDLAARLGLRGQPLTQERVANLLSLKRADGDEIEGRKKHNAREDGSRPPIGFLDLTISAPKSVSVAWALAPNQAERDRFLSIHRSAVEKTMQYVAEQIGYTQRGGWKNRRSEFGEITWISFQHYTSRPVDDQAADCQLHTHAVLLPHVLTGSGHIGALDLDHLSGRIKEFGFVYQAFVAAESRRLGVRTEVDERTGTVRYPGIPDHIIELFSKRTKEAITKAQEHAARMGLDWREL
jgi:conjugative relaxase-like TrwC/TraI family protein